MLNSGVAVEDGWNAGMRCVVIMIYKGESGGEEMRCCLSRGAAWRRDQNWDATQVNLIPLDRDDWHVTRDPSTQHHFLLYCFVVLLDLFLLLLSLVPVSTTPTPFSQAEEWSSRRSVTSARRHGLCSSTPRGLGSLPVRRASTSPRAHQLSTHHIDTSETIRSARRGETMAPRADTPPWSQ